PLGLLERGRRWLKREPLLAGATTGAVLALLAAVLVPLGTALRLAAAVRSQERAKLEWDEAVARANQASREALSQQARARTAQTRAEEAAAAFIQESARAH